MEELQVIRLEDFKGSLSVGLSGAPEVREAVKVIASDAERQFYARLLGVTETRQFLDDLAAEDAAAVKFADTTRYAVTRYAYCKLVEDSQDNAVAVNGVFMTDSATGEAVAPNRRLAATWNDMVAYLRDIAQETHAYRCALRVALGLNPAPLRRDPFMFTNPLML